MEQPATQLGYHVKNNEQLILESLNLVCEYYYCVSSLNLYLMSFILLKGSFFQFIYFVVPNELAPFFKQ